jgi:hypothetical protein
MRSSTAALFTKKEREKLELDRKRFLAHTYITTGIPLNEDDEDEQNDQAAIITEEVVTTEIEQALAATTIQTQGCCPVGCSVDHAATLYGTAYTRRSGKPVQLPLREDTGSGPNWLPRALASELQCDLRDAAPNSAFFDFGGNTHVAKKKVTVFLNGTRDKVEEVEFYITPEHFPLQCAILGNDFIKEKGHPHQWFPAKPDTVGIIIQARVNVSAMRLESQGRD